MPVAEVAMSLIVPTRERAHYLPHALRTCLADPLENLEVLVLDNASDDATSNVIASFSDTRLRYLRSDRRLSMRQNFERGLHEARGEVICFIGDDDGIVPGAVGRVLGLMQDPSIAAVSNDRAHYGWPDLNATRRNLVLVPRGSANHRLNSFAELREMPLDVSYYRLPCLYHGFVRRSLVEKILDRDKVFFNSSQVDMYSAIALSMENVDYIHAEAPLIVNGGSRRSNGASYQGQTEGEEKARWLQEDDLSFLPGFDNPISVGCAVIESGIRYANLRGLTLEDVFDHRAIMVAMTAEWWARKQVDRPVSEGAIMLKAAGITAEEVAMPVPSPNRLTHLAKSFFKMRPIDAAAEGVEDVHAAALMIRRTIDDKGTSVFAQPLQQLRASLRFAQ